MSGHVRPLSAGTGGLCPYRARGAALARVEGPGFGWLWGLTWSGRLKPGSAMLRRRTGMRDRGTRPVILRSLRSCVYRAHSGRSAGSDRDRRSAAWGRTNAARRAWPGAKPGLYTSRQGSDGPPSAPHCVSRPAVCAKCVPKFQDHGWSAQPGRSTGAGPTAIACGGRHVAGVRSGQTEHRAAPSAATRVSWG